MSTFFGLFFLALLAVAAMFGLTAAVDFLFGPLVGFGFIVALGATLWSMDT